MSEFAALIASAPAHTTPCDHKWTDDGLHLLVCTSCGAQEDHNPGWRDMATAPRDGTMLRLLVEFTEHATEDADQAPTIGANNFDNDGEDRWQFAGWCWSHDHFVEGRGEPIGWLPMITASAPASADAVSVPVELLAEAAYWLGVHSGPCSIEQQLADELRALLAQSESEGVK